MGQNFAEVLLVLILKSLRATSRGGGLDSTNEGKPSQACRERTMSSPTLSCLYLILIGLDEK